MGYQTMMNEALKQYLTETNKPLTEKRLREVLLEVLPTDTARATRRSSGRAKSAARRST